MTASEAIAVINSPMLPTDAVRWWDEIAKRGEVRFIINTLNRLDHIAGNFFFPGGVIFHEACRGSYALSLTRKLDSEMPGEPPKVVTLNFAESYCLRVKKLDMEGLPLLKHYINSERWRLFFQGGLELMWVAIPLN